MTTPLLNDRDMAFQLYEMLATDKLFNRPRYQMHDRQIFDATLNSAKQIAQHYFAPHFAKADRYEPTFDGESVNLIPETKAAWDAFAEAGFLSAHYDFDEGGSQLPSTICHAIMAYFFAANAATTGYPFLTIGAANLIDSFGSEAQKARFLPAMKEGRFAGTMALTEPGQGSALGDIKTQAEAQYDGSYRIYGQKMFISGGDQSLTENIIHLLLARIKGAPKGIKGLSLFIVPKFHVKKDDSIGECNDVHLAGLLHKMGYRNTTSTVLSFGEKEGGNRLSGRRSP